MMRNRTTLALLLVTLASGLASAQAQQAIDFSKVEIRTTRLADDLHLVEGQGGTLSVLSGPDGVLVVDSQFAQLSDRLLAAIRKLSPQPLRYLVNTHHHPDHVGGNENFAKAGAVIFSRETLRARLAKAPGAAPGSLPVVTYDGVVTLQLNGEEVQLVPIRRAHTDGDTLVHFRRHDVLAVGDYLRSLGYPRVDLAGGGSLDGLLAGFAETVARAGPATKIVPGHGVVMSRDDVIAQHRLVLTVRDRVAALVARGATIDEVIAAKPTAEFDAGVPQGPQTSEQFLRWLHAELVAGNPKP